MAQEIYHRSEWGNPNEQWGNVYLNADLTNELYKRASEYENSWVTDQLLNGVGTKPSIIMTPTAYEDGQLNSVKPAKTFGSELVTNGDFSDGTNNWSAEGFSNITIGDYEGRTDVANINISNTSSNSRIRQPFNYVSGKKYKVSIDVYLVSGNFRMDCSDSFVSGDFVSTTTTGSWLTLSAEIEAISTGSNYIWLRSISQVSQFYVSNVSVKEVIDADFDFTRGSSATRVNEKGLIQDVQVLSDELVQNGNFEEEGSELVTNGDFSQIGSELIVNGDFATDSDWTLGTGWSIEDGKAVFTSGASGILLQSNIVETNKLYKLTFDVIRTSGFITSVFLGGVSDNTDINESGRYTYYITSVNQDVLGFNANSTFAGSIDNVSVQVVRAELDQIEAKKCLADWIHTTALKDLNN